MRNTSSRHWRVGAALRSPLRGFVILEGSASDTCKTVSHKSNSIDPAWALMGFLASDQAVVLCPRNGILQPHRRVAPPGDHPISSLASLNELLSWRFAQLGWIENHILPGTFEQQSTQLARGICMPGTGPGAVMVAVARKTELWQVTKASLINRAPHTNSIKNWILA